METLEEKINKGLAEKIKNMTIEDAVQYFKKVGCPDGGVHKRVGELLISELTRLQQQNDGLKGRYDNVSELLALICGPEFESKHGTHNAVNRAIYNYNELKQQNESLNQTIKTNRIQIDAQSKTLFEQQCYTAELQKQNEKLKETLVEAQKAERFLGYLVEECEGNIITEEYLISTMDGFLKKDGE